MSEPWKQWEGQTVDEKFLLLEFLGSTHHSAVFRTQTSEPQPKNAAIKFLFSGASNADTRLALWKRAAHLSHGNLLTIYDCGRCQLGESDLLYVVMEYAEENLGDVLPQRALTEDETRDFLEPTLDALVYLHSKGLAHGHLKPSNLLATQDCLKLSSDAILTIGAQGELHREGDGYDAPELRSTPVTAKADVWSLGATLVEALTQKPPVAAAGQTGDPVIPDSLPEMFREIARHGLRQHENQRWSIGEIAARLNPTPLAAAAVASTAPSALPAAAISPLSVPLATEPAVPLAKLPTTPEIPARRSAAPAKTSKRSSLNYFVPAVLVTVVILGLIFAVPKIFNFQHSSMSATPQAANEPEKRVAPAPAADRNTLRATTETAASKPVSQPPPPAPTPAPAPAVLRTDSSAPVRAKSTGEVAGRGQVLDQVLPEAAPKALATIQGTVHVVAKVRVDAAGNVSDAELDSPGPSKYFADLAEKAARRWQFAGAESEGHGVPSAWLIRFEFSPSGVRAFPQQTEP